MYSTIALQARSLNTQITIAFMLFSALLFGLSTLSGNTSLFNTASLDPASHMDADRQAAEYQTWSDPFNDSVDTSDTLYASNEYSAPDNVKTTNTTTSNTTTSNTKTNNAFPFETQIRKVAGELNVDESLVYAVTKAESSFRSGVQSSAGAVGLMQVVGSAAGRDAYYKLHKKRRTPTKAELKDPYTNLQLGSTYLKLLEEHHFGHIKDKSLRKMLVLAAYNWGPMNVKRNLLKKNPPRNAEEMKWVLWVKAPRETYSYVHRVLKYQAQFSQYDV